MKDSLSTGLKHRGLVCAYTPQEPSMKDEMINTECPSENSENLYCKMRNNCIICWCLKIEYFVLISIKSVKVGYLSLYSVK